MRLPRKLSRLVDTKSAWIHRPSSSPWTVGPRGTFASIMPSRVWWFRRPAIGK